MQLELLDLAQSSYDARLQGEPRKDVTEKTLCRLEERIRLRKTVWLLIQLLSQRPPAAPEVPWHET